jgi:anti-sigma-K factor RskA
MEHTEIQELSAAYALDALSPEQRAEFEEHLLRCAECRETVSLFQETAAALAYGVEAPEPPPILGRRIMEQARRERQNVVPLRPRWVLPATATVAAVAACVAVALGVWTAILNNRLDARPEALALEGANGSLIVSPDGEATLLLEDLGPAPVGKTYEAWVIDEGSPLPAGTFPGGGRVAFALTRAVPEGAVVAVTIERAGGVQKPTNDPVFSSEAL